MRIWGDGGGERNEWGGRGSKIEIGKRKSRKNENKK